MPLRLITPPAVEPLTPHEVRGHLRIDETDTSEDGALMEAIQAAREQAEHETGRALISQTWEQSHDVFPGWPIVLEKRPAQSVVSVTYLDAAGTRQTVPADAYALEAGEVRPVVAWPTGTDVRIRFIAGYGDTGASVPAGIKRWMKLRVGTLYAQREEIVVGTITAGLPDGYADRLLDPYRTWG